MGFDSICYKFNVHCNYLINISKLYLPWTVNPIMSFDEWNNARTTTKPIF